MLRMARGTGAQSICVLLLSFSAASVGSFGVRYSCDKFQYAKSIQRIPRDGRLPRFWSSHYHRYDRQSPVLFSSSTGGGSSFKDQLQHLKDTVDIVDLVESYHLDGFRRHTGDSSKAVAVCPFHDDHSPSLSIDSNRQMYKCFACGAGGDIFRFVQEYSKLPGQDEFESFGDVVRHISTTFGDGNVGFGSGSHSPRISTEEQERLQHKKERIYLANAAAATFYVDCLFQPFAGGARAHLKARGLASQATIQTFALGYAPDVYFGPQATPGGSDRWGEGSMVHHLRDLNFTATEIVEAGLAVRTKKTQTQQKEAGLSDNNSTIVDDDNSLDFTSIMDRFRGRLMVPIFDRSGKRILGFGGREIPPPDADFEIEKKPSAEIYSPKYLNTPETLVFEKRKILFGQSIAQQAMRLAKSSSEIASTSSLLVVEGYMDVVSLWTAGFHTVVASMGTALSQEQLNEAARTAGTRGGRIVLCLDNDEAGIAAVGRLCSNGMISATAIKNMVDIAVAKLPRGIKDPAEFFESLASSGATQEELVEQFQKEVIDSAVDWTDWYIQTIVGEYECNAPKGSHGSFSDVFERVADFLATSLQPAERTKRAYEVAGMLSSLLAKERNATQVSSAVSMQLESDLIDLAARIAAAKDAVHRRAEASSGFSPAEATSALAAMARGHGPTSGDEQDTKFSFMERFKNQTRDGAPALPTAFRRIKRAENREVSSQRNRIKRKRYRATMKRQREVDSLTPHFSGFRFGHRSDADWLGLNEKEKWKRNQYNLVLGHRPLTNAERVALRNGQDEFTYSSLQNRLVYFNSADFNGYQFLTDDALNAGYASVRIKPDPAIVERGLASIIEQNIPNMIRAAEDALLRTLVKSCATRTAAKNILDARSAVSSGNFIFWSCPEREWLFKKLIGNDLHAYSTHPVELRTILAKLPDAPSGAFSPADTMHRNVDEALVLTEVNGSLNSSNVSNIVSARNGHTNSTLDLNTDRIENLPDAVSDLVDGTLDHYFFGEAYPDDVIEANPDLDLAEDLLVQEILVNLLWASAAMKASLLRKKLSAWTTRTETEASKKSTSAMLLENHVFGEMENGRADEPIISLEKHALAATETIDMDLKGSTADPAAFNQLQEYEKELVAQLSNTMRSMLALKQSAERITRRLMDHSSSNKLEGRLSASLQADLASRLDEHISEICSTEEEGFVADNDEPYEVALERMAEDWREWFDDEYAWSPSDGTQASFPDIEVDTEFQKESLDEDLARIDHEWAEWLTE